MGKHFLFLLLAVLLGSGCHGGAARQLDPPPASARCGDGNLDPGEECDGSNLNDATCRTQGYDSGQLTCSAQCRFATSACVRTCGNGVLDPGEGCDGALGLEACATFGYQACTAGCQLDSRHCVTQAFEPGPALDLAHGGPAIIGDLPPRGPGDLVMAVASYGRVEALPWVSPTGFDAVTGRKLSFQTTPVLAEVCDADGDGNQDVATLNDDGSIDQYVYLGAGYALQAVDAGCPGGRFIGRGTFGRGPKTIDPVIAGCGGALVLGHASARRVPFPDAGPVALGDLDGDGLTDLLAIVGDGARAQPFLAPGFDAGAALAFPGPVSELALGDFDADGDLDAAAIVGQTVQLFENTGAAFAPRQTFSATGPAHLAVVDLDLDGRPDLFFSSQDLLALRRNRGNWLFAEFTFDAGPGERVSVSLGDADGDGDQDVALTTASGALSTHTTVVLNRVR